MGGGLSGSCPPSQLTLEGPCSGHTCGSTDNYPVTKPWGTSHLCSASLALSPALKASHGAGGLPPPPTPHPCPHLALGPILGQEARSGRVGTWGRIPNVLSAWQPSSPGPAPAPRPCRVGPALEPQAPPAAQALAPTLGSLAPSSLLHARLPLHLHRTAGHRAPGGESRRTEVPATLLTKFLNPPEPRS